MKNKYSLSLIRKSLNRLGQIQGFSQLDLITTYYYKIIRKANKSKLAFKIYWGYFEYQVILFGLTNISVIYKRYYNKILTKKLNIFVIIYLTKSSFILKMWETPRNSCLISLKPITNVFIIYHLKKVLFSSKRVEISWLYCFA